MATYYVDYAGSAGTGDGSSFANRADKIESIFTSSLTTLGATDEVRIKGNPITSLGTAAIADTSRVHTRIRYLHSINTSNRVVYSTTTGETKINFGAVGEYGFVTGDQIMITQDSTTQDSQPSMLGVWSITVDGTDYTSNMSVKLDGYTATSNATSSTSTTLNYLIFNKAIKLNTTGLFKNIACMDAGRSAWTAASGQGTTSIEAFNNGSSSNVSEKTRWPTGSDAITVNSGTAVGKVAHYQLPSTLDLSGYQQVSFMIYCATDYGDVLSTTPDTIRLCTDTAGNTSVHTIPIDLKGSQADHWTAVTVDLGVNLNASINSIALYREQTHSSSYTFYIQNVVACKNSSDADSITHSSCIGLKEAGNPIWSHVDMLWESNGTYWVIPIHCNNFRTHWHSRYSNPCGYWSSSGSAVNIYKVEPIRFDLRGVSSGYIDNLKILGNTGSVSDANLTISDLNTVSGGWNDTDMSSKSADYATILEGNYELNAWQLGSGLKYINFEDIAFHKFYELYGPSSVGLYCRWHNLGLFHCDLDISNRESFGFDLSYQWGLDYYNGTVRLSQHQNSVKSDFNIHAMSFMDQYDYFTVSNAGATYGSSTDRWGTIRFVGLTDGYPNATFTPSSSNTSGTFEVDNFIIHGGVPDKYFQIGGQSASTNWQIGTYTIKNGHYVRFSTATIVIDTADITRPVNTQNNLSVPQVFGDSFTPYGVYAQGPYTINGGNISGRIDNYSTTGVMQIDSATHTGYATVQPYYGYIKWRNYNGTSGDHRTFINNYVTVTADTSIRHTASGSSLKADIISGVTGNIYSIPIGKIAVNANSQVTVSVWAYNTNTLEDVTLRVKQADWAGVTSNQDASMTSGNYTANTWTQLSKSFTPTEPAILDVEIVFTGKNSTSDIYYDDFEVTQV